MDPPQPGPSTVNGRIGNRPLMNSTSSNRVTTSSSPSTRHSNAKHQKITIPEFQPRSTVGQFAFAPSTQTTIVTTTTTTTTSFPPMLIRPPRHLNTLNPKDYPLASTPTPSSIKRLCFDLNGIPTYYRESDDPQATLTNMQNMLDGLEKNNGMIRKVERGSERYQTPPPGNIFGDIAIPKQSSSASGGSTRKRPASPLSNSDDLERDLANQKSKRRLTSKPRPDLLNNRLTRQRNRDVQTNTPASSQHEDREVPTHAPRPLRPVHHQLQDLETAHAAPIPIDADAMQIDVQLHDTPVSLHIRPANLAMFTPTERNQPDEHLHSPSRTDAPHLNEDLFHTTTRASSEATANTSTQPLSLPSPSLSPVTAALHHGQGRADYFASMDTEDEELTNPFELSNIDDDTSNEFELTLGSTSRAGSGSMPLIMQLPSMVEAFDAMPQALKTYLMHQFLRRCDKNTLQFVAETVNPALKCDFLGRLPTELSLNIIKYLDYKSLANSAQVSKKWRILIDSDEWTWKRLFEVDGYCLSEGELERAVREGWGYQDPEGYLDCERDIQTTTAKLALNPTSPIVSGSRKRKVTRLSAKKSQKQRQTVESLGKDEFNELINELSNNEGFSAAIHAASANPPPGVGLPSLTNLHLYKSIYRRHHIIRKSWIRPDVKPRHISFRGHQRHVVTCLQFDTDKILTGSDDTNINVYDTNSGALLTKLEGHEGGVWALQYHHNTLVSGSTDRTVRVWDIEQGECTQIFHGHTSTVRCLQILLPTKIGMKDGKAIMMPKQPLIITGSRDSTLKVWKLPLKGDKSFLPANTAELDNLPPNPYLIRTLQGHIHSVRAIAAHGDTLVSGSYDHFVRVWKISTGESIHKLTGHSAKVYSVVLDHKRNRCISGSMDSCVKVWSLEEGSLLYTLEGHTSLVGLLDLSHDHLVSAAADASLRIWDPESGVLRHTLSAHTGAITCFQHDGHKVISGSDGTLKMWDVKTGLFIRDLLTNLSGVWQVRFNERRCVAAVQRDNVTFIEVLDFGAARDGVSEDQRGRRIVVNSKGVEVDPNEVLLEDP